MRHAPVYQTLVDLATLEERHITQNYCLNRQTIMEQCNQLEPDLLSAIHQPYAISPTVHMLLVLHFLASGSFQITVGLAAGMSQPMFSHVSKDVLCTLLKHLDSYIRFPQRADLSTVKADFYDIAHIPHVIGAIDGTHIALVPPRANEQVYRNKKMFYSINVQVVCFTDQYISQGMAKFGTVYDSYIPRNSNVSHMMAQLQRERGPGSLVCLQLYVCICYLTSLELLPSVTISIVMCLIFVHTGESGYPNLPRLLTPVRYPATAEEDRFKVAHGRMRRVIKRSFGLLVARFWCLHMSRGALLYRPLKVCQIVVAYCMLHNLAMSRHIPLLDEEVAAGHVANDGAIDSDEEADNEDAADTRTELIQQYFL
ncbi:putative nuclease HARBI1 [Pleurodeles waltl]|uniref:putative nuclease HARBI1 n=1 Tax=Pleurodeles waltl TaxID=8319 RepID=UPI003709A1EB